MPYIPDPLDESQPTTDKFIETAAAEFRAIKEYLKTLVLGSGGGGSGGSATTGANLGTGVGVFAGKSGDTLQFKSLVANPGLLIEETANSITFSYTGALSSVGALGPTGEYVELPSSIGSGSNSGIPNRGSTTLKIQYGTSLIPATNSNERAISSQAVVSAPYPWTSPSHWSPNEFSVINKGNGRVNAMNAVLVTNTDNNMDNTAAYTYAKSAYTGTKAGAGGVIGYWGIVDTRGSFARGVGAEIVMLHDSENRYDLSPDSGLSENASDSQTIGTFHAGMRISILLSNKIIPRGLDIITGSDTAGFDTGINVQGFRQRGLYFHNNLNPSVGGTRAAVEYSSAVAVTQKVNSPGGYVYQWEQNYSASKGWYYTLRKDAGQTFFSAYADGTVTLSTSSTGAKMQINPTGEIIAGHTTPTNAGFMVPAGGCFWLTSDKTSYIAKVGSSIVIVKDGNVVASW